MSSYECNTGMLIYQDENGNYLPFLLRVRDNEIIWHDLPEEILNLITTANPSSYATKIPSGSYVAKINDWDLSLDENYKCTATKEFALGSSSNSIARLSNRMTMYGKEALPFNFSTSGIHVQCTLKAGDSALRTAVVTIDYTKDSSDNIKDLGIYITQAGDTMITEWSNSSVFVTVTGTVVH